VRYFILFLFLFSCQTFKQFGDALESPEAALKAAIDVKMAEARVTGRVGEVSREVDYMRRKGIQELNMRVLERNRVFYIPDTIGRKKPVQWDYQYDSIALFQRGGGDCNSINRAIQVNRHVQGTEAFLVTYVAKDFKKNHTTCITKARGQYWDCDYGYNRGGPFDTMHDAVQFTASLYKTRALYYVVQDITWRWVDL